MQSVFLWIVIALASISTVTILAEAVGLLPDKISRWINRNRISSIIVVLEQLV